MAGSNFVDYVKIFARSGHGGAGSAHFRREKFVAFGGPDGGDGGKGGSIVLQGDSQYWTLIHLKYQRHQFAEDGQCGSGARSSGRDARDIVIPVPLGTVARRVVEQEDGTTLTEDVGEVTADGEQLVLLKGGRGGLGNWHFKSATNHFLGDGEFNAEIFRDGINADRVGKDYKREVIRVSANKKLKLHMAPGGGFVIRITK